MNIFNYSPRCFLIPRGINEISIGRSAGNDIIIADQHISSNHARIKLLPDKMMRVMVAGRNGISVGNHHINMEEDFDIEEGECIKIYDIGIIICRWHVFIFSLKDNIRIRYVEIDCFGHSKKSIIPKAESPFLPSVRVNSGMDLNPIEIDGPPQRKNPDKQPVILVAGPALTIAVPILLGAGRKIMVIAGVIAALWATINVLYRRKSMKREEMKRRRVYREYIDRIDETISGRYRTIRNKYITDYPTIKEYMTKEGNPHLLWSRAADDDNRYHIRVGTGDIPFPVDIVIPKEKFAVTEDSLLGLPAQIRGKYSVLHNIPVTISIGNAEKYAILTDEVSRGYELIFSIILQASVCLDGSALRIACITDNYEKFAWAGYISNCWFENTSLIASISDRERIDSSLSYYEGKLLVYTDDRDIFDFYAPRGFPIVFMVKSFSEIPPGIGAVLAVTKQFNGIIYTDNNDEYRQMVNFDCFSQKQSNYYAKRICSISSHAGSTDREIPDRVLFDELIDAEGMSAVDILNVWREADASTSLAVPIGLEDGKRIRTLDLDEKYDGPHGLMAGTTGSGKSELLQTIILSLAYHFPPSQVNFFLIDYKGGGMANAFTDLPHVSGSISNLSGPMIERAMISIRSEIEYRQRLFAEKEVNSISDYMSSDAKVRLPHIIIIVDEFAELKREEPDFLFQLVSVAQIGRSLGVHLILATQKPAGCVDDKIWSNSKFRICLKVRDKMDSMDMLHRPDAAFITNVGRAFLQVGNDEIFTEFQSAYSSAPAGKHNAVSTMYLYDKSFNRKSIAEPSGNDYENAESLNKILKQSIREAFSLSGGMPIRKLWCDELPAELYSDETEKEGQFVIGMYDDPYSQKCGKCLYFPEICRNTAIIGLQGSGKSFMLLRVLECLHISSASVNFSFYIIDFGGKLMSPFAESNLCGGYISSGEYERIPKLFRFLNREIKDRLENNSRNYKKILVLIDNYGSMAECITNDIELIEMLRVSVSVGVYFLITANSIGQGELPGRVFNLIDTVITLSMRDKYSYAGAFSTQASKIPEIEAIPGRGLMQIEKRILQFQAYIPFGTILEKECENTISSVIKLVNIDISQKAVPFPYVPAKPVLSELSTFFSSYYNNQNFQNGYEQMSDLIIGYKEESGELYSVPIGKVGIIVISGRARSGRKNTLSVIEYSAAFHNIKSVRIHTMDELIDAFENETAFLLLIDEVGKAINDFYVNSFDREKERSILNIIRKINMPGGDGQVHTVIVGIISQKDKMLCSGRAIWNELMEHPYGISMGGSYDEQSMFDFSYLNYTAAAKRKSPGCAGIPIYEEGLFFGEVVIPLYDL